MPICSIYLQICFWSPKEKTSNQVISLKSINQLSSDCIKVHISIMLNYGFLEYGLRLLKIIMSSSCHHHWSHDTLNCVNFCSWIFFFIRWSQIVILVLFHFVGDEWLKEFLPILDKHFFQIIASVGLFFSFAKFLSLSVSHIYVILCPV